MAADKVAVCDDSEGQMADREERLCRETHDGYYEHTLAKGLRDEGVVRSY